MRPEITAANEYITPAGFPQSFVDKITFRTRFVFTAHFLEVLFSSRSFAKKGVFNDERWVDESHKIFTTVERCGGRFHIAGFDYLRNITPPVLFLSNHISTLETMIFPGIIRPFFPVTFVVKEALVRHWAFKHIMLSRNPIVLSRENPREDLRIVLEQGAERLQSGVSVVIFPQGTRKSVFKPEEFNSLGTKLAAKTGVNVIPIAIKTDFWGESHISSYLGPIHRERTVYIDFGEPMKVSGSGKEEHKKIVDFIDTKLKSWQ